MFLKSLLILGLCSSWLNFKKRDLIAPLTFAESSKEEKNSCFQVKGKTWADGVDTEQAPKCLASISNCKREKQKGRYQPIFFQTTFEQEERFSSSLSLFYQFAWSSKIFCSSRLLSYDAKYAAGFCRWDFLQDARKRAFSSLQMIQRER